MASTDPAPSPCLAARGLCAGYGGKVVLADVDLALGVGEMLVVIGPNGAGKSTLVRALAGTLRPSAGEVRLLGDDVGSLARVEVARRLAVVPQSSEPAHGWRVREVVMMGRAPHQGPLQVPSAHDADEVRAALERADVAHLADRRVDELSGGEQKLVAIARALAQQARVLLLDEASASLDARHTTALYDLARREVRERGVGCLAVVHDLNIAAAYADRVALLEGGRLTALGTVEQVMTYRTLREAFGVDLYVGLNELDGTRYFVPRRSALG